MGRPVDKDQRLHWDETYKMEDFYGTKPSLLAERAMELFKNESVEDLLELGCGQGRDTFLFARNGIRVYAIDYSDASICQMRQKAKEQALDKLVTLKVRDIRRGIELPDESVDAIYSNSFFDMELREDEIFNILQECHRILKPGGLNIYSVRCERDPQFGKFVHIDEDMYQNPMGFVVHFFTENKIDRLSEGYVIESIAEFEVPATSFNKVKYEVVLRKPMQ
jgi:ubiquinone/menaquinone biosynthesis C-methylase UbiE